MLERGLLSPNTARDLLEEGRTDSTAPLCRVMGSEGRCWSRRVLQDDSLISHMLLFTPRDWCAGDACTLLDLVQDNVSRVAAAEKGAYWAGADFQTLLTDLLTGKLTGMRSAAASPCLPHPPAVLQLYHCGAHRSRRFAGLSDLPFGTVGGHLPREQRRPL